MEKIIDNKSIKFFTSPLPTENGDACTYFTIKMFRKTRSFEQ